MKTIRARLTRRLALGALVIAGFGGAAAYLTMRAALLRQFDESLLGKARAVCALTEQERDGRVNIDLAETGPLGFGEDGTEHSFQLRLGDGKTVARSPSLHGSDLPLPARVGATPVFANFALSRVVAFTFSPRPADERPSPAVFAPAALIVASSRHSLDGSLRTLLAALALSTGVLLLSAWVLVPRVLRRGMRPLDDLADRVTRVTADSLTTRFPDAGIPAELAPIARCLNDLLVRIEASFERERRFSADLAHELRTPLAELRSQAELALKWPNARAVNADADTLAIAQRMERLVNRLLALARSEHGHPPAVVTRIPLETAVQAAWRPFVERAASKLLHLRIEIDSSLTLNGDPALLCDILANVLENAVDYTLIRGDVNVDATVDGGQFAVRVTNIAQDLDASDLEKMFDRFWRKEAARNSDEHAGLGLALARSYAHALGWELRATLDGTSRLVLTLSGNI